MANSHDVVSNPFTQSLIKTKAAQLCRRSDFSRSDLDDLEQGMRLYLLQRSHFFDPQRGSLEAFVTELLKYWVRMELRFRGREKRRGELSAVSLEATEIDCDGESVTLDSLISEADLSRRTQRTARSAIEHLELMDEVRHVFGKLNPAERALVILVADLGVAGAARRRRVSRRQIENAMARMRARFEPPAHTND